LGWVGLFERQQRWAIIVLVFFDDVFAPGFRAATLEAIS